MASKLKRFKLLDVVSISNTTLTPFTGSKEYIATGDIENTRIVGSQKVTYEDKPSRANLVLQENQVLFAKMKSTTKVLVGTKETETKIFSTGFYILQPNEQISPEYLYYYFLSTDFNTQKDSLCTGATMSGLNNQGLARISIPLPVSKNDDPDIDEQRRIISVFQQAELLKNKRARADSEIALLIKTLFHDSFIANSQNTEWAISTIDGLSEKIVDCPHSTPKYSQSETKYACVRSSDIQNGAFDWSTTKYVNEDEYQTRIARLKPEIGDIVLCREGARLGNAAIITSDEKTICLGQRIMLLRADLSLVTPEYLHSFLLSDETQKKVWDLAGGAASPHLNVGAVKKMLVPVPPLNLQKEFSEKVRIISQIQSKQADSKIEIEALFNSCLTKAFQV